jgi:hypothetical protein
VLSDLNEGLKRGFALPHSEFGVPQPLEFH